MESNFKVIILGDSEVGKSCMACVIAGITIPTTYLPTNDKIIYKIQYQLRNRKVNLDLWDLSGKPKNITLTTAYSFESQGVIFAYSRTNTDSLSNVKLWQENLEGKLPAAQSNMLRKVLVGLKSDSPMVAVSEETGRLRGEFLGCKHYMCTSRDSKSYDQMVIDLLNSMLDEEEKKQSYGMAPLPNEETPLLYHQPKPAIVDDSDAEKSSCNDKCCCCMCRDCTIL